MKKTGHIDYVEFPAKDLNATKTFFKTIFNWSFIDYGPDYMVVENAGVDAGFYRSDNNSRTSNGSTLIVLYSGDLKESLHQVKEAGGEIIKDIFSFPGGHRFHFTDPNGNEFAVWSEKIDL